MQWILSALIIISASFAVVPASVPELPASENDPETVIIISGAKCRKDLHGRYRFQKYIPLNHIVPAKTTHLGADQ